MRKPTRRKALKTFSTAAALVGANRRATAQSTTGQGSRAADWGQSHDRVWIGAEYWSNPMEDWRIVDGAVECQSFAGGRNVHWITRQITNPTAGFEMSVIMRRVETKRADGGAGFLLGVKSELNEHRSNAFANNGVPCGLRAGYLFIDGHQVACQLSPDNDVLIKLSASEDQGAVALKLSASQLDGADATHIEHNFPAETLLGNIAIANNFDAKANAAQGARYRFRDWSVNGEGVTYHPQQKFGPILWSMYTLSDSRGPERFVLKLSALTGPMGVEDNHDVELWVQRSEQWESLGISKLDPDAWTATFRIPNWDETVETPYRLVYREAFRDGSTSESEWTGVVKANPVGRPVRLAALTCQHGYGFPYEPVANNVAKLEPDLVYFSGDQLYESNGGFGIIREPAELAILNYLRKFYMFGWAFRHVMKDAPTLCIPDDHDVFQGNLWGEGGAAMRNLEQGEASKGGYREPARMVNVVHKTNAAHHPEPFSGEPAQQNISVYYGDVVYGNVSFAVIADRQFKSGPERVNAGGKRVDHVVERDRDTHHLDKPGLVLLGERQHAFLRQWVDDWRGHEMKVLLSQTVFAGVATHHGRYDGYLKADLDSGGWPQTPRNEAIKILRSGMPLHVNGDQHLTSLVQYGVDRQRDSNWSFCTPAISAGYPRWWRPDEVGMPHANRPQHGLSDTGEYLDGFGNKLYVYCVGNPAVGKEKNRYQLAHQKGSGFGFVTIDTEAKTYRIESFRFLIDATSGAAENQFPGWPVVIHQRENKGDNMLG
jgi:hypothetical protein